MLDTIIPSSIVSHAIPGASTSAGKYALQSGYVLGFLCHENLELYGTSCSPTQTLPYKPPYVQLLSTHLNTLHILHI